MSRRRSDDEWAARARSFGAVARDYDRARPSYPEALADDVVAALPGPEILEVGAGTGKASLLFAVRPVALTCLEPDAGMAEVLRENTAPFPNVEIVVSAFEDWQPAKLYDGIIAAQSWHWTAPEHRYHKAAEALRVGGKLALFWNGSRWDETPQASLIDDVYRRHGIKRDDRPGRSKARSDWPRDELEKLSSFADVEVRTYFSAQTYTAQEWCDYAASTSEHLILDPPRNAALLADLRRAIERSGGMVELARRCDLFLATRQPDS